MVSSTFIKRCHGGSDEALHWNAGERVTKQCFPGKALNPSFGSLEPELLGSLAHIT